MRRWIGVILAAIMVGAVATWMVLRTPGTQHAAGAGTARATPGPGRMEVITPTTTPEHRYVTRGRLEALPGADHPYLRVHHETIENFVQRDGSLGMREMIMDFPALAPGVLVGGLAPGDPIEFEWEVRYGSEPTSLITAIRKLPAGTDLRLSEPDQIAPK